MDSDITKVDVAIFGVGKLGSLLGQELIRRGVCSTLFLANRSQRRLDGIALSLRVYSFVAGSTVSVQSFKGKPPVSVGVVVLAVKDSYDPRDLLKDERLPHGIESNVRTIGLRRDLPLVREACRRLGSFDGIVLVLTNPVDVFTALVKEWIPTATVLGLGLSLDSARLAYCSQLGGISCRSSDAALGGVHIGQLIQLRSLWPDGSALKAMPYDSVEGLIVKAREIGPEIVRGLGFTLHDCATVFANDVEKICRPQAALGFLLASLPDRHGAVGRALLPNRETHLKMDTIALSAEEERQVKFAGSLVTDMVDRVKRNPVFGYTRL
jgi:malate/lactate dehydrogenase